MTFPSRFAFCKEKGKTRVPEELRSAGTCRSEPPFKNKKRRRKNTSSRVTAPSTNACSLSSQHHEQNDPKVISKARFTPGGALSLCSLIHICKEIFIGTYVTKKLLISLSLVMIESSPPKGHAVQLLK